MARRRPSFRIFPGAGNGLGFAILFVAAFVCLPLETAHRDIKTARVRREPGPQPVSIEKKEVFP
jgi:hypothetical protein